jgi:proline dehydrogenase
VQQKFPQLSVANRCESAKFSSRKRGTTLLERRRAAAIGALSATTTPMSLSRRAIVAASQSVWLREHAMRWKFVRRASKRFLPGERAEDALAAATELAALGISAMPSRVGENITDVAEANAVAEHYVGVLAQMRAANLPASLSIKPTQLGLDLDAEICYRNLVRILDAANLISPSRAATFDTENKRTAPLQNPGIIWIDMESSAYTDRTLELFRRVRATHANVGICLQAYLRRTPADLESLLPLGAAIRLVKGAYAESADVAFPAKSDVDDAFFVLAQRMFAADSIAAGNRPALASHDSRMIARIIEVSQVENVPQSRFEFQMLYGIQRELQKQLARDGFAVSVLISYGTYWFPWYMRRLAERPANVWFVVRSLRGA